MMDKLIKGRNSPNYVPDYIACSLKDIDFEELKNRGIKYLAFDADSTLVKFRGRKLNMPNLKLLRSKRKLFERWCIASNRPTNDLQSLGKSIDAEVVRAILFIRKPQKRYFNKVADYFNAPHNQIAMIGDKLISDIWGANRVGFVTVWVSRLGSDNPWDKLIGIRKLEKRLMSKYYESKKQCDEK